MKILYQGIQSSPRASEFNWGYHIINRITPNQLFLLRRENPQSRVQNEQENHLTNGVESGLETNPGHIN